MKSKYIFSRSFWTTALAWRGPTCSRSRCLNAEWEKGCGDPAAVSMWSADLNAALRLEVMLNFLFLLATAIFEGLALDCVCSGCVLESLYVPHACVNTLSKSKTIAPSFPVISVQKGAKVSQPCKCWVTCGLRHRCYSFLVHLKHLFSVVIMWEHDSASGWSMPQLQEIYISCIDTLLYLVFPLALFNLSVGSRCLH